MARCFSASISAAARVAHPLQLLAGGGDVRFAGLLGHLLGAGEDLVRLAAGLGEGGEPLLLRALAVAPGLLGVLEALLDALAARRRASR